MSQFLPDGPYQSQPPTGVADITPPDPETTSADVALMQRVLSAASRNPNLIPADFMAYVLDWIQTQRLQIPIGQIPGFSQFTANSDQISTEESTTSATFVDLATVGPSVSGLSDGRYVVLFGASLQAPATHTMFMGVSVNGATPDSTHVCETETSSNLSLAHGMLVTLAAGDGNSLVAKYRVDNAGSTGAARYRWLIAFKYAN